MNKEHVIFYFSGTGNSLQVARDLQELFSEATLVPLADYDLNEPVIARKMGVVFPVYGFGLPRVVARFLERVPIYGHPYIYGVATYGGSIGASLKVMADILDKRAQKLSGAFKVKMPGNCITLYDALPESKQKELFEEEKLMTARIADVVHGRGESLSGAHPSPLAMAAYLAMKKPMSQLSRFDEGFVVDKRCIGCGECVKACPVHNITLGGDKRPVWHHHCESCMGCIQHCPEHAINVGKKTRQRHRYVNPNV